MNNVTDYRANGYERALQLAKQLLTELDVEIIFKSKTIRKKRGFLNMSPQMKFQMHLNQKNIL